MANRETKEAAILALPDQKWARLMKAFQNSRDALTRQDEQFKPEHERHYDELLDKIIKLGGR